MMTIQLMYFIWKCAVMFSQRSWEKSGSTLQGGLCGSIRVFIRDVQSLETTEPLLSGWSTQQRDTYSSSQCAEITSTSATAVCLHLLQWECFYWHTNSPRLRDIQFILLKDIRAHHFTCSSVLMRCKSQKAVMALCLSLTDMSTVRMFHFLKTLRCLRQTRRYQDCSLVLQLVNVNWLN